MLWWSGISCQWLSAVKPILQCVLVSFQDTLLLSSAVCLCGSFTQHGDKDFRVHSAAPRKLRNLYSNVYNLFKNWQAGKFCSWIACNQDLVSHSRIDLGNQWRYPALLSINSGLQSVDYATKMKRNAAECWNQGKGEGSCCTYSVRMEGWELRNTVKEGEEGGGGGWMQRRDGLQPRALQ